MSKVSAIFHIVFTTKDRKNAHDLQHIEELYRYLWNRLKYKGCYLYRIGGIENHIHILVDVGPTISLSAMVNDLKANSSAWIKASGSFPAFECWSRGYYAGSISFKDRDGVIEYIKNQRIHHLGQTCEAELESLCGAIGQKMFECGELG